MASPALPQPQPDETAESGASYVLRRDAIRRKIAAEGFVRVTDLAGEHGVSVMTIHRDLDDLQVRGFLVKVRGGATTSASRSFHGDMAQRLASAADAKELMCNLAMSEVEPGSIVIVDDSTTALPLTRRLQERAPLTVITNFNAAVQILSRAPGIDLVVLGGSYFPAYDACLGISTARAVDGMRADLLVMSTTAITGGQCLHQSQDTVVVKRALMDAASRRVLLADHTKFRRRGLYRLAGLEEFDRVIVDEHTPQREIDEIRALDVVVDVARPDSA